MASSLTQNVREFELTLMPLRDAPPVDELLNNAFELAYFILGDRPAAIYVATAAMDKLKIAAANQGRRLHYKPVGRSAFPASRTKINLNELHLLQRLVYIESEMFERLIEGQRSSVSQADLIIRYIKHLIRITIKHNSFYVTLGLCRLLYNFSTRDSSEIYNLVLQDPERIRDDYYYRSRKQRLMQEIKDRFGNLLRTQVVARREERFQPQENSLQYARLVKECLSRFTPWLSACVLPTKIDPNGNVISPLLFAGTDPDKEHEVELNRIHALIHPDCFARLTAALGFAAVDQHLELPTFFLSSDKGGLSEDRLNPAPLTQDELEAIRHYLDKNALYRRHFSESQLKLVIDGTSSDTFWLNPRRPNVEFKLSYAPELIEVRSVGATEEDQDAPLAFSLLKYDKSGVVSSQTAAGFANRARFQLKASSSTRDSIEPQGVSVKISFDQVEQDPSWRWLLPIQTWLRRVLALPRIRVASRPVLALILLALFTAAVWVYIRSRHITSDSNRVAQVYAPSPIGSSSPRGGESEMTPPKHITTPELGQRLRASTSNSTNETPPDATRGTTPKPSPAKLASIKRVYVDQLGDDDFSKEIRNKLTEGLRSSGRFEVVLTRADADAILSGSLAQGKNNAISLELIDPSGQVIWSLSTRGILRSTPSDTAAVCSSIVSHLLHDVRLSEQKR